MCRDHDSDADETMNRLASLSRTSKALALLAITLLPVQQSLAATGCCLGGQGRVIQAASGSGAGCCSQTQTSCCTGASGREPTCCEKNSSGSQSKPCKDRGGCEKNSAPAAAEPPNTESSLQVVPTFEAFRGAATIAIEISANDSLANALVAVASFAGSGSDRCIQLCCFRL